MATIGMRFDLRTPDFGTSRGELYATALELAAYADRHGFDFVQVSEHHGAEDGYCPAPAVFATALAARTQAARVRISALVLPLHHPVRLAEDLAVLDVISGGRAEVVVGAGYRPFEFGMLGIDRRSRGRLVDEGIAVLRAAWTGEPFEFRGQPALVRPRPLQDPFPLMIGGSSEAAARRAARLDLDFMPTDARLYDVRDAERARLGLAPARRFLPGPFFLHVAEDPDAAWARLAPHLLHDTNAYAAWLAEGGQQHASFQALDDAAVLRQGGRYVVATPDEAAALVGDLGEDGMVMLHPVLSGIPADLAWSSVELFAGRVLPRLRRSQVPVT